MDINKLTIGEAREIASLFGAGSCSLSHSFKIGQSIIVRSVTHYYTGRVEVVTDTDVVLSSAAWIASTGRWNAALTEGKLDEVEPYPDRCVVSRGAIIDWCEWPHDLPGTVQ